VLSAWEVRGKTGDIGRYSSGHGPTVFWDFTVDATRPHASYSLLTTTLAGYSAFSLWMLLAASDYVTVRCPSVCVTGVAGRGRGGTAFPHFFFDQGTRPPLPPLFWTEIRAKVSPLLQLVTY